MYELFRQSISNLKWLEIFIHKTVFGLRPFQYNKRPFFLMKGEKSFVEFFAFIFQNSGNHFCSCVFENFFTFSVHFVMTVHCANHHVFETNFLNFQRTRRSFSEMCARFKRNVNRGIGQKFSIFHRIYGIDFRVRFSGFFVVTFANNFAVMHNYASHQRIWVGFS